jgi:hypothetical protein
MRQVGSKADAMHAGEKKETLRDAPVESPSSSLDFPA